MFNAECKYAIRAVVLLAKLQPSGSKMGAEVMSTTMGIPKPFLSKILQQLAKKEIINSTKGPNGGFWMSPDQTTITLFDLIDKIDCGVNLNGCVLGLPSCSEDKPCAVHHHYAPFKRVFVGDLQKTKVSEAADYSAVDVDNLFSG